MKINEGKFVNKNYVKSVSFSKAVLWKSRQISLNPKIVNKIKRDKCVWIIFEDWRKNEKWGILVEDFIKNAVLKTESQEKQWYINIDLFKKKPIYIVDEPTVDAPATMKLL